MLTFDEALEKTLGKDPTASKLMEFAKETKQEWMSNPMFTNFIRDITTEYLTLWRNAPTAAEVGAEVGAKYRLSMTFSAFHYAFLLGLKTGMEMEKQDIKID